MIFNIFKFKNLIMASAVILAGFTSCNSDTDDDDDFWDVDYYPVIFEIEVLNDEGENVLDASTPGNILDKEMYVLLADEKYDVHYGRPSEPYFPYPHLTRVYMPSWWGAFISPYWYIHPDLPERGNNIYIGEFPGDYNGEVTFQLVLDNSTYSFTYKNKVVGHLQVERHFYLDGEEMPSSSFTIVL